MKKYFFLKLIEFPILTNSPSWRGEGGGFENQQIIELTKHE